MNITTFIFNAFQMNTYIIEIGAMAVLVDPGCQTEAEKKQFVNYIDEKQLQPQAILLTHGHVDHILACKYFQDKYQIPAYMHQADMILIDNAPSYASVFGLDFDAVPEITHFIDESTKLSFGELNITPIHVPGHSPGSIVYWIPDMNALITGDVLFNGSIGRTDLPGGHYQTLIDGIKTKLWQLPDTTIVYPGHGSTTTIGNEKTSNPFLTE